MQRAFRLVFAAIVSILLWPSTGWAKAATQVDGTGFGYYTDRLKVGTETLLFSDVLERRVQQIGERIAQAAGRGGEPLTFRVVNNPVIDASSAGGGFVYVNTGLLDILEAEDELAAVLAHELAHVYEDHQIRFVKSKEQTKATGKVMGGALRGALSMAGSYGLPSLRSLSPVTSSYSYYAYPAMSMFTGYGGQVLNAAGAQIGGSLGQALMNSMIAGYGKRHELDADALALRYLHGAGYDPHALIRVFEKLVAVRGETSRQQETYGLSHLVNAEPGLDQRIRDASAAIQALGTRESDQGTP